MGNRVAVPTMSTLDLKIEGLKPPFEHTIFRLLRDYLQPDTTMTLESTARSILALLPDSAPHEAPHSYDVYDFGGVCIELSEQIPYHHPSQLKLVGLLELLGQSTKLGQIHFSEVCTLGISGLPSSIVIEHS